MHLLILAAMLAQTPTFEGDQALAEMLRDAQVANRQAFQSGKITGRIDNTFHLSSGDSRMQIRFEIWWDKSRTFSKLKSRDHIGTYTQQGPELAPDQEPEWEYIVRTDDRCYIYNAVPKLVAVNDGAKFSTLYLEVNPWDSWFHFNPTGGRRGSLWFKQIGSAKDPYIGRACRYRIEREGADLIRQVRQDPDGGVNNTVFSMAACGNVVETSYVSGDPRYRSSRGTYRWRTLPDGLCVLDGWNFSSTRSTSGNVDCEFGLTIDTVDVKTPVDPSRFTLDFLLRELPANIILQDNMTLTNKRVNVSSLPVNVGKTLEELAEPLRGRGFLAPGK